MFSLRKIQVDENLASLYNKKENFLRRLEHQLRSDLMLYKKGGIDIESGFGNDISVSVYRDDSGTTNGFLIKIASTIDIDREKAVIDLDGSRGKYDLLGKSSTSLVVENLDNNNKSGSISDGILDQVILESVKKVLG